MKRKELITDRYKVRDNIKKLIREKRLTMRQVAIKFKDAPMTFISRLNGYGPMTKKREREILKYLKGLKK